MNEKREIIMQFRVTPKEYDMIETKMKQLGTSNMSAYLRKMAVDGYVVRLDLPELKEMTSLLRRISGSINQIAQRVNETHRIYDTDMGNILRNQDELWQAVNKILAKLSSIT